jgi:hypothetical protein
MRPTGCGLQSRSGLSGNRTKSIAAGAGWAHPDVAESLEGCEPSRGRP